MLPLCDGHRSLRDCVRREAPSWVVHRSIQKSSAARQSSCPDRSAWPQEWRRGRTNTAPAGDLLERDLTAARPDERWVAASRSSGAATASCYSPGSKTATTALSSAGRWANCRSPTSSSTPRHGPRSPPARRRNQTPVTASLVRCTDVSAGANTVVVEPSLSLLQSTSSTGAPRRPVESFGSRLSPGSNGPTAAARWQLRIGQSSPIEYETMMTPAAGDASTQLRWLVRQSPPEGPGGLYSRQS